MTNLDSILKSRDITLPTNIRLVKAMVFPVVMYGCESWTIKKPECWRIDAFELWCWTRLLRVPWTARRSNQSTWCKELTHLKRQWCWARLKMRGEGDNRRWDGWMASPTWWTWVWVNSGSWCWTGSPGMLQSMRSQRVRHNWATELNWYLKERNILISIDGGTPKRNLNTQALLSFPELATCSSYPFVLLYRTWLYTLHQAYERNTQM